VYLYGRAQPYMAMTVAVIVLARARQTSIRRLQHSGDAYPYIADPRSMNRMERPPLISPCAEILALRASGRSRALGAASPVRLPGSARRKVATADAAAVLVRGPGSVQA